MHPGLSSLLVWMFLCAPKGTSGDTITGNMVPHTPTHSRIPNIPSFTLAIDEITNISGELLSSDQSPVVCGNEKDYDDSTYSKHTADSMDRQSRRKSHDLPWNVGTR